MSTEKNEFRVPVKAFRVHLNCVCGNEMMPTGSVLASNPPQYPHKCNKCGRQVNSRKRYPFIEHRQKRSV